MSEWGQLFSNVCVHWRKLMEAKAGFFSAVVLALVIGVFAGYLYQAREVAILGARVAQKDDIIQEARRQLDGVPPEEITNEIEKLKVEVETLENRDVIFETPTITTKNEDDTFTIEAAIRVVSSYAPNWLVIYAEAEGIISIDAGG